MINKKIIKDGVCLNNVIPFLSDIDDINESQKGHSSAFIYIVSKNNNLYFLKIYKNDCLKNISEIDDIYTKLHIPTAKIFEYGYIKTLNRTYVIYEYIEGDTLFELTKKLDIKQLESIGYKVGKELHKFKKITSNSDKLVIEFEKEIEILKNNAFEIEKFYECNTNSILPFIDLEKLTNNFTKLKKYMYKTKPSFIHNDINLNNIIVKNGTPFFIDNDGGKIKFRALDFRGNCWWGWTSNNIEKERAIFRGIYNGLFNSNIPIDFHKELAFTMMYEFLLRLTQYRNDIKQIEYSFTRFKPIFDETNYFSNYIFNWFKN